MTRLPDQLRKAAFPTPEERWAAGGAEFDEHGIPHFPQWITHASRPRARDYYARKHPEDEKVSRIGKVFTRVFTMNDGIERVSRLWLPDHVEGTLTGQSGTAFTTSIDGYGAERSRLYSARVDTPNIQHDAEHSGRHIRSILDIIQLATTLADGQTISLAKSAEAEMLMTQYWVEEMGLSPDIAAFGDSWDAITALALPTYAEQYGLKVPYIDPKALVLHDPIEPSYEGVKKVAKWVRDEIVGGTAVVAALLAEGDLSPIRGTIPLNPHFWVSSFTGVAPSLLSGEAGRFMEWLPKDVIGYANLFEKDALCEVDVWQADLRRFDRIGVNLVPEGLHAHLLSRVSQSKQRGRMHRLHNENLEHGDNYDAFDAEHIHGSYLGVA